MEGERAGTGASDLVHMRLAHLCCAGMVRGELGGRKEACGVGKCVIVVSCVYESRPNLFVFGGREWGCNDGRERDTLNEQ